MQITIDIPEAIGQQLTAQWGNVSQRAKEALAIEARSILLSHFVSNSKFT